MILTNNFLLFGCTMIVVQSFEFQKMDKMIFRSSLKKIGTPEQEMIHEVTVAVKQKNLDLLKELVEERNIFELKLL